MAKHAKPRKTEVKGWRPTTIPLPDGISPNDLDRMAQKVQEILTNSHIPSEPELAILEQVRLLCLRVMAFERKDPITFSKINQLNAELSDQKDILHKQGFRENRDIIPLNLWITRRIFPQKRGELLQQVERKMRVVSQK